MNVVGIMYKQIKPTYILILYTRVYEYRMIYQAYDYSRLSFVNAFISIQILNFFSHRYRL